MSDIRLVIFDLDGTLYDLKGMKRQIFVRAFPAAFLHLFITQKRRKQLSGRVFDGKDELLSCMMRRPWWALPRAAALQAWYEQDFYRIFLDILGGRAPRDGASRLLAGLAEAGIPVAVVSDYGHVAERLQLLGLVREGMFTASCEDYGVLKPCRRPFEAALSHFDVSAAEALVVGDRDDTDGASARLLGCEFFMVKDDRDFLILQDRFCS